MTLTRNKGITLITIYVIITSFFISNLDQAVSVNTKIGDIDFEVPGHPSV